MPDHVHLFVWPGNGETGAAKLSPILSDLKGSFARSVIHRWKQLWAPILSRLIAPDGSYRFWQHGGATTATFAASESCPTSSGTSIRTP
ncbi:MAG: hypothetical protein H7Y88_08090 [Phycisphaerales bacterium]|nr:hypothetical protein [Phycisphaerales bacterium]